VSNRYVALRPNCSKVDVASGSASLEVNDIPPRGQLSLVFSLEGARCQSVYRDPGSDICTVEFRINQVVLCYRKITWVPPWRRCLEIERCLVGAVGLVYKSRVRGLLVVVVPDAAE